MKKLAALVFILLPLCASAQILGEKHRLELGAGLAIPKEFLYEVKNESKTSAAVYGAYRYSLTPDFSVGALYSFVVPHATKYYPPTAESEEVFYVDYKQQFHSLSAVAEYRIGKSDSMGVYVGGGVGVHYYYAVMVNPYTGRDPNMTCLYPGVNLYMSFEFFKHLRMTVGHYHDLQYHFIPNNPVASYYSLSVGWSF